MVISVFRKVDCDLTVIYNRFYFVFRINFIFIYIVFVQITTCSLFFVFVVYMIFHLLISFCRCIAQAHNANTDKSTDKKSYNKSQLKHLFHKVYFSPPDSRKLKIFCCRDKINRLWIALIFTLSYCRYLSSIPCDKEHIRRHCIIASLEFHHRGDLPQPPSLLATVLSRSSCDWTEVSLSPLPVIAVIEFAFQCLNPEVLYRSSLMWLVRSEQQKESI